MINEFIKGFNDAGQFFNEPTENTKSPEPRKTAETASLHYRLSWVIYLALDSETTPVRAPLFSKFHSLEQRVPELLAPVLTDAGKCIDGVFPEQLSPNEDLGYVVFHDRNDAVATAGRLASSIERQFESGSDKSGYMYAELELSACEGELTALAMNVKTAVLLNPGFDCVKKVDDVIDTSSEFAS